MHLLIARPRVGSREWGGAAGSGRGSCLGRVASVARPGAVSDGRGRGGGGRVAGLGGVAAVARL